MLNWINEKPLAPGYYWIATLINDKYLEFQGIVQIEWVSATIYNDRDLIKYNHKWVATSLGSEVDHSYHDFSDQVYWYGPVEPPKLQVDIYSTKE